MAETLDSIRIRLTASVDVRLTMVWHLKMDATHPSLPDRSPTIRRRVLLLCPVPLLPIASLDWRFA